MSILALHLVSLAAALMLTSATQNAVTPIEKVITLLEDLKTEVTTDGTKEATTYDTFACWCKDTTATKSKSILDGADNIDTLSATIAKKTSDKVLKETEVADLKVEKETAEKDLANATAVYQADEAAMLAKSADLNKAIVSLGDAIKVMEKKKGEIDSYTVSLLDLQSTVAQSLAMADALNIISAPKRQIMGAFMQQKVDPADAGYKYHSADIVKVLKELLQQFMDEKTELADDWKKTADAYKALKQDLSDKISTKTDDITAGEGKIETLTSEIATAKGDLVDAQALLKDDQTYLKDMTEQCETTANDWDQQSKMRADELEVLTTAITILTNKVKDADAVNVRALLLQGKSASVKAPHTAKTHSFAAPKAADTVQNKATSFVQIQRSSSFLELRREDKVGRAVASLKNAGQLLNSPILSTLAMQIAADPFKKVKELIEKLIVRLVAESTAEATKKGFCDTELGKSYKDRDFRHADVNKLNVEAGALEVKSDELKATINELTKDKIPKMKDALETSVTLRNEDKAANLETIKTGKEGLEAVTEAITVLEDFYRKADRATVLLQESPIAADMPAVTAGAYKGKQDAKVAIIALLEQIKDDFQRTIAKTTTAEEHAAAEFVEFQRTGKSNLKAYETDLALSTEELETVSTNLAKAYSDMKTNMKLLDESLKRIMELKPMCIDTTMPYAERVAKREEEIKALKNALCILDTEGNEPDCA